MKIQAEAVQDVVYDGEEGHIAYREPGLFREVDLYAVLEDAGCNWRYPEEEKTEAWFTLSLWTGLPVFTL